jgi:hypothetical protein
MRIPGLVVIAVLAVSGQAASQNVFGPGIDNRVH